MPQFGMGHVLSEWGWRESNFNTAWMQVVLDVDFTHAHAHADNAPFYARTTRACLWRRSVSAREEPQDLP